MRPQRTSIHTVATWVRRQPPKVKAFLAVVSGMAALVLLRFIVHEHDNLFVAAEAVHSLGISVLIYKLMKEKTCAGKSVLARFLYSLRMDLQREEKWIKHYSSHHKILLVGEGNFSFALCLAKAFGSASNMVATSLDSEGLLIMDYSGVSTNLKELKDLGCTVVHRVDANTMNTHPLLQMKLFDRIVFNFPHDGFTFREHDSSQIALHQELVSVFMKSARTMVTQDGEIHVTHKNAYPFYKWEIEKLAEEAQLFLVEKVPFFLWDYPGYINKKGSGSKTDQSFPVGDCSTFKFSKKKQVMWNLPFQKCWNWN